MLSAVIAAMRPRQWTKNLIIFAGLVFSQNFFHLEFLKTSVLAFVAFCLAASSVYMINDIKDIERDRLHPVKRLRPLPAGRISASSTTVFSLILAAVSISTAFWLHRDYGMLLVLYWVMMVVYSFKLKHMVIVDIIVISSGFIIRAVSGAIVLDVVISRWLLACAIFLSLFLILAKRRIEIVELGTDAVNHRAILEEYGERFLDQMIAVVTACTIISYVLYTVDPGTVEKFQTHRLIWTVPFVVYGIFRYLYLVYQKNLGGRPEMILLNDRPILIAVTIWIIVSMFIVY